MNRIELIVADYSRDNPISRKDLVGYAGLPDRTVRRIISESGHIGEAGDGYFWIHNIEDLGIAKAECLARIKALSDRIDRLETANKDITDRKRQSYQPELFMEARI